MKMRTVFSRWLPQRALNRQLGSGQEPLADTTGVRGFEIEAEELLSRQRSARAQKIVRTSVVVVVVLIAWAAWASIDEVTRGDGKVIPSHQLQVVQSLDGGVVSEILVREGMQVEAGQLLLRIDETRATSGVRESAAQVFALHIRELRLKALAEGTAFQPPAPAPGNAEEAQIIAEERNLYQSRVHELQALLSINHQQVAQKEQELIEVRSRRSTAQSSLALTQKELQTMRPLLRSGSVSELDILRLEREVVRQKGDFEQSTATIARVQSAISEAQRKTQETELSFRNDARKELSDVLGRLNALNQGAVALADKVDKAQVKSPVRGRVQRLLANTVGGVVQPGKDLVEIVPLDDALVLETKVQPKDIAFIHPGQIATVKFSSYDFSIYGGLEAKVENISPDTQVDERGNAFYVIRVRTEHPNLSESMPIIAGMTAEVDILTGKKSVLGYLLKPVLKAHAYALRER
ncbi:HlyD family type I secretion periplasmic adaptor subunit [Leptothrix ochracea]|uniref:HlyD family type I secretion periplasmic adaptor subunit n=1 Tax=Leptothrix ochracea TaxID=735331 RepID=UPI0034E1AB2F